MTYNKTYNKQFDLDPSDIDIIETCLRKELHIHSNKYLESVKQTNAEKRDSSKQRISAITELLGKIHNQKIWFTSDPAKPWVPRG
jgi:hypothetical protein